MGSPCILLTPGQGGTLPSTRSSVTPAAPGDPSSTEELTGGAGSAPHCEKRDSSSHRPHQPDVLAGPARHRCTHTWLAPCSRRGSTLSQWQVRVWARLAVGPYGLPPGAPRQAQMAFGGWRPRLAGCRPTSPHPPVAASQLPGLGFGESRDGKCPRDFRPSTLPGLPPPSMNLTGSSWNGGEGEESRT